MEEGAGCLSGTRILASGLYLIYRCSGSAGVELIFLIAALMMLCFGFVLMIYSCLSYCWTASACCRGCIYFFFFFQLNVYSIVYGVALSNKSWGKEGGRRDVCGYGVCLPKYPWGMLRPCFPGGGFASACWWETVNGFFHLLCLYAQLCFT